MNLDENANLIEYLEWKKEVIHKQENLQKISDRNNHVIAQLLADNKPIRIELGAGQESQLEGWTTVDISGDCDLILDLRNPLPFPDESVSEIYSSHVLEHFLYPYQMAGILNECYRVLKKGGIFSVCVPNARIYIEAYLNKEKFDAERYCQFQLAYNYKSPIDYINYIAYMAGHHLHLFDEDNLVCVLSQSGFSNARLRDFDSNIDLESRRYGSIYAIAEKTSKEENNYQMNLKNINFIIFPDWSQSIEVIFAQLLNVCQSIIDHPNNSDIALLIDIQNTNLEDANFLLADVLLNLCYQRNMETDDDKLPQFNLFKTNSPEEYKGLLPILHSRIILESENKEFINQIGLELPCWTLEEIIKDSLDIEKINLLDQLQYNTLPQQKESSLSKAYQKFAEQKFPEAVELFKQTIIENPQFSETGLIPLAHSLILANDWQEISRNLPPGINYLQTSGWLNSLYSGKPINQEAKPIPWYTYPAIEFIENKIDSDFRIFEYGSGNSSLWWSERVTQVISIESDANWFEYIKENMPSNVELYLIEDDLEYASAINQYEDHSFDIIIVDGSNRNQCAEFAISKVKNQGFIIFDNTDDHRHAPGVEKLQASGFIRIDFYGMIPSYLYKNCTSIFFKDVNLLSRGGLPSEKRSCLGRSCFQITSPVIAI